jgi:N-acetylglucosamine-6-phosphate deacetylase
MMEIGYRRFVFIILTLFLTMAITSSSLGQKKNVSNEYTVEGIHYLDNSPVSILIKDGRISSIKRIDKLQDESKRFFIAPGLIDNQVNGFAGVSFVFGGGQLTIDGVHKATKALWESGVTTYMPTLTTNDSKVIINNLKILRKAQEDGALLGSIAGIHIEGPYISPVDGYRGAHPLKYVRKPDWNEFMEFYKASGGNILQITLAPEVEGAMEFISLCREKNIIVALGHHNATMQQVTEAIDRGAQIATHLGNGCANTINRHINPLWPQLSDDRLMASIICDGFHLLPEQIKVFYKVKGPERLVITSDVTSFASLPPGEYKNEDGETIELLSNGLLRYPAQNVLYGSAAPMNKGIGHIMKVTGCSLGDAIRMASTNPARLYGLNDRGEIKPGMRADLVLFSMDDYQMQIKQTIVAGKTVYQSK